MVKELFAYGTLMQHTDSSMAHFLHAHATSLGTALLPGRLYDLGSYPGAVYDPLESRTVTGQIYQLDDPKAIFPILDRYEGVSESPDIPDEYARILVEAKLEDRIIPCWIYQYKLNTANLPLIPGGNYLAYFALQHAHRQFLSDGR